MIAERFSGDTPRRRAFFVRSAVALLLCLGRVLVLGARERSERVTTRRQPPRQRSRRLVYSQAHVLLPFDFSTFFSFNL